MNNLFIKFCEEKHQRIIYKSLIIKFNLVNNIKEIYIKVEFINLLKFHSLNKKNYAIWN